MNPVSAHADRFVVPDDTYLLSHSVGLLPHVSREAAAAHFDVWATDPAGAWPAWLHEIERFRAALGQLLGGSAASFCPQTNVSSGLTKVLGALRPSLGRSDRERPTILLTEEAFPSLGFVCQRADYDVRYVAREENVLDVDVWARHMRDVDVVLITHVHSNTGQLIPVAEVATLARDRSVVSIVDVAQSVGVIPIDLDVWAADVVLGSCVKWLCGGPGAGWLWATSATIERCEPTDVGWFSHEDPFEFDIHHFAQAADALRFWGGTPSVLPFTVARRSIDTIVDIGVGDIRRHNVALSDRLVAGLGDLAVSPHDAARRSGTVVVDPGAATDRVLARLAAAHVSVDHRPSGIRMSPHIYTTADEIDRTVDVVLG